MAKFTTSGIPLLTVPLLLLVVVEVAGEVSFPSSICVTWSLQKECIGGDRALTCMDVKLTYNCTVSGDMKQHRVGPVITKNDTKRKIYNLSNPNSSGEGENRQAEYYFEQLEHGGGLCNCLKIYINCSSDRLEFILRIITLANYINLIAVGIIQLWIFL